MATSVSCRWRPSAGRRRGVGVLLGGRGERDLRDKLDELGVDHREAVWVGVPTVPQKLVVGGPPQLVHRSSSMLLSLVHDAPALRVKSRILPGHRRRSLTGDLAFNRSFKVSEVGAGRHAAFVTPVMRRMLPDSRGLVPIETTTALTIKDGYLEVVHNRWPLRDELERQVTKLVRGCRDAPR